MPQRPKPRVVMNPQSLQSQPPRRGLPVQDIRQTKEYKVAARRYVFLSFPFLPCFSFLFFSFLFLFSLVFFYLRGLGWDVVGCLGCFVFEVVRVS
ncbi:uncharacterized protein BDW43DRAFT_9353 [Aspergillus alliaceus]|uniref:uncharacterized protein n=1 Tax=Petromyces alliaceus TaxID=209559 RepID=UPI0012A4CCF4|nr:uncharacterized protein BDW43DRAFT_9353 [Aspergillus alliaceus]KAB8239642.1 hypothetical protein BDW43DRAFT_9353 [Aspergillus alliaceus]